MVETDRLDGMSSHSPTHTQTPGTEVYVYFTTLDQTDHFYDRYHKKSELPVNVNFFGKSTLYVPR